MGRYLSQYDFGDSKVAIDGVLSGRDGCTRGDLAQAQCYLGDEFPAGYLVEFLN
jgi:hypothetical protein